jgi:xylose isomerase
VVEVLKEKQQHGHKIALGHRLPVHPSIHPRLAHGAASIPNADVFVYAAAQVKKAIEVAHELCAAGYVFWGGREGCSASGTLI